MKNIMGALLALPLVITASAIGGDVFSEGDSVLGNAPAKKPALIERFNPATGERTVYDAAALGTPKKLNQDQLGKLVSDHEADLAKSEVKIMSESAKDKPTTAWCGVRYYRPVVYTYYYDYVYVPVTYYYYTWTYTWSVYTTYTYYGGYRWTYYW